MRRERLLLADIVEAAEAIGRFVAGRSQETFSGDDLVRSAVLHKLAVIGEAAARLPRAFCKAHPSVPWADLVAFRNIVVHSYFAVDWAIVWTTATKDVPELHRQVASILGEEFPPETTVA
jgi:uncharacterized protein with HEPN domain